MSLLSSISFSVASSLRLSSDKTLSLCSVVSFPCPCLPLSPSLPHLPPQAFGPGGEGWGVGGDMRLAICIGALSPGRSVTLRPPLVLLGPSF